MVVRVVAVVLVLFVVVVVVDVVQVVAVVVVVVVEVVVLVVVVVVVVLVVVVVVVLVVVQIWIVRKHSGSSRGVLAGGSWCDAVSRSLCNIFGRFATILPANRTQCVLLPRALR